MIKYLGLILLLSLSSCQMSKKKLRKLKASTVIENPYDIKSLPQDSNPTLGDEKPKFDSNTKFHNSGPTVVDSKDPEAVPVPSNAEINPTLNKGLAPAIVKAQIQKEAVIKKIEAEKDVLAQKYPFKVGEKIEYAVNYFALEAGRFTFEVKPIKQIQNRPVFHFYVSAKTSSLFAWVYTLKDFAESFWDMKTQRPYLMKIYGQESRYIREVQTAFDWTKKEARYQAKIVEVGKGLDEEDKIWTLKHMDAQDVVSALYFLRTKKLEVGKTFEFRVAERGKDILVKALVLEEVELSTKIGKFMTYVVKPTFSVDGAWKQKGEIKLWLTKDEFKVPIQFEAKIKVGTIRGRLHSLTKGL